jgi:hypothetical protein
MPTAPQQAQDLLYAGRLHFHHTHQQQVQLVPDSVMQCCGPSSFRLKKLLRLLFKKSFKVGIR